MSIVTRPPNTSFSRASAGSIRAKSAPCVAVPMHSSRTGTVLTRRRGRPPAGRIRPEPLVQPVRHHHRVTAQRRQARREGQRGHEHRPGVAQQSLHHLGLGPQLRSVRVVTRDVQQVVVQVVGQRRAGPPAMRGQCGGGANVGHGVTLRGDDVGAVAQRFRRIRQHDIDAGADRRMVQRLQQPDIRARTELVVVQQFRHQHDAGASWPPQIDQPARIHRATGHRPKTGRRGRRQIGPGVEVRHRRP